MPGTESYNYADFKRLIGPLPRGNHRHCKGPLSGGKATKKARKKAKKTRRRNR
jgi:hypothetical protein